tara:strand:- start:4358 stop:4918 length:561 start_codon:yes stop_codon:yes gene_type:complete
MRIIGGNLKGRKILLPKDKTTRPIRDLVKESLFNLLEHSNKFKTKIENAVVLDLFSGSGSFGIECISRKAQKIYFIENYPLTLEILNKNISKLNIVKNCDVSETDCFKILNNKRYNILKFDIIFIDPPYRENKINLLIDEIKDKKILNKNGIIIIHRHKKDDVIITNKLNILDIRKYGISKIIIGN